MVFNCFNSYYSDLGFNVFISGQLARTVNAYSWLQNVDQKPKKKEGNTTRNFCISVKDSLSF